MASVAPSCFPCPCCCVLLQDATADWPRGPPAQLLSVHELQKYRRIVSIPQAITTGCFQTAAALTEHLCWNSALACKNPGCCPTASAAQVLFCCMYCCCCVPARLQPDARGACLSCACFMCGCPADGTRLSANASNASLVRSPEYVSCVCWPCTHTTTTQHDTAGDVTAYNGTAEASRASLVRSLEYVSCVRWPCAHNHTQHSTARHGTSAE